MRSAGKVTDLPSVISVNQTIKSSEPPWTHFQRTQIDTAQGGRVRSVTVVHRARPALHHGGTPLQLWLAEDAVHGNGCAQDALKSAAVMWEQAVVLDSVACATALSKTCYAFANALRACDVSYHAV